MNNNNYDWMADVIKLFQPQPIFSASAAIIAESGENGMTGVVTFKQYQAYAPVITFINVTGMGADKQLGVHIHWYGDIQDGCNSTGPHYRQSIVSVSGCGLQII